VQVNPQARRRYAARIVLVWRSRRGHADVTPPLPRGHAPRAIRTAQGSTMSRTTGWPRAGATGWATLELNQRLPWAPFRKQCEPSAIAGGWLAIMRIATRQAYSSPEVQAWRCG